MKKMQSDATARILLIIYKDLTRRSEICPYMDIHSEGASATCAKLMKSGVIMEDMLSEIAE